jgi:predicted ArsR family transcriptional regulator
MSDTRQDILETLNRRGRGTLDEIARAARHSILVTRYHLGVLVAQGLVVANAVTRRATVGRPQTLYALADDAHTHLPKRYDALAAQLLDEITASFGRKEARALIRRAGRRLAADAPPLRRRAGLPARLNRAADFLSARGYSAGWDRSNSEWVLWVCNCPYRQVALTQREVCELDLALLGELVQLPLRMTQSIAKQDLKCVFVVKPADISRE